VVAGAPGTEPRSAGRSKEAEDDVGRHKPAKRIINLDANPMNADWLRTMAWDLPTEPEVFVRVVLHGQLAMWREFKTSPAYRAMPPELEAAVEAYFAPHKDPEEEPS